MSFVLAVSLFTFIPFGKSYNLSEFREAKLELNVGAFKINIMPVKGKELVVEGKYDPDIIDSVEFTLGKRGGKAYIEINTPSKKKLNLKTLDRDQTITIKLPKDIPFSLNFSMGLVKGDIELGGLKIRDADFSFGAGDVRINFSRPTTGIEKFKVSSGLAKLDMEHVGNAQIDRLDISSGLGKVGIDLRGKIKKDMEIKVSSGLQALELHVPEELGVFLEEEGILNLKDLEGMEKAEGGYISKNFNRSKYKAHIVLSGALNSIDLDWVKNEEIEF